MIQHKLMPVVFCFECAERMELIDDSIIIKYQVTKELRDNELTTFNFILEGEKYQCPECKNTVIANMKVLSDNRVLNIHYDIGVNTLIVRNFFKENEKQ